MSLPPVKGPTSSDWSAADQIDRGEQAGYSVFARAQGNYFYFRISAPVVIGPNTTLWLNTDQDTATGFQIFGFAGGAEYNVNFRDVVQDDGGVKLVAALYTGGAGETLVFDNLPLAVAPGGMSVDLAVSKIVIGGPVAIDTLYDVNDVAFLPPNFTSQPYTVFTDNAITRTDPSARVGIVWSDTTAANYFSPTAYSELFRTAESQARLAGIPFDNLTEADLTNLARLANYDALVFPTFRNVLSSQVTAITNTLAQAVRQFGLGLITAGDFMTNDQTGAALAGDPYGRMNLFFDATRVAGGNTANISLTSTDTLRTVLATTAPGAVIGDQPGVDWTAYQSVNGRGQTIATQTVNGETYSAVLATRTATNKNVLFSSIGVMTEGNLLRDAINYVAKPGA